MSKVTIEMEWTDALYVKSILSSARNKDLDLSKIWERDGDPVPEWLFQEIDKLGRVIDIFEKEINRN